MSTNLIGDVSAVMLANASLVLLLVKATTILLAAIGITMAMQRASAGARHLVWLVSLATILLVPVLASWAPIRLRILPPVEQAAPATEAATPTPTVALPQVTQKSYLRDADGEVTRIKVAPVAKKAPSAPARVAAAISSMSVLSIAFAVWAVVALAVLASLAWASFAVRRIVRNASPLESDGWRNPLLEVADRMGLEELPLLLKSDEAKMPFACGMMQPTIVFPAECENWSLDRRHAVLLHELAHVKRRDLFGHTLGRLACAAYWFHPLVWKAAKELRAESERACDDLALACGTKATDYAEHLLDIVTSVRGDSTPLVAMAMARRKEFEGRMLAILDPHLRHSTPSRKQSLVIVSTLAMVALTVGAIAPAPREASAATVTAAVPSVHPGPSPAPTLAPVDTDPVSAELTTPDVPDIPVDAKVDAPVGVDAFATKRFRQETSSVMNFNRNTITSNGQSNSQATAQTTGSVELAISALASAGVHVGMEAARSAIVNLGNEVSSKGPKGSKGSKDASDDRASVLARILRTDADATNRRVAAWGLNEYSENADAEAALVSAVRHDADARVREMAAWSLGEGNNGSRASLDALAAALKGDAEDRVRKTSAWSLGQIEDKSSVDALLGALSDASSDVRLRAAWAIGSIEPKQAPKQVVALLGDKEPRVRLLASWALYKIEDPSAVLALERALKTEMDRDVQIGMIHALASMGEKSVDALSGMLQSSDDRVKQMAVRALAGGHGAGPWPWPWPEPRPQP